MNSQLVSKAVVKTLAGSILALSLSGCYFGNKEVDAPATGPYFYETQFNDVQLCATISGTPTCVDETTNVNGAFLPGFYIPLSSGLDLDFSTLDDPSMINALPSDVVSILQADTGIYHGDGSLAFIVQKNPDNSFGWQGSSQFTFFNDLVTGDTCSLTASVQLTGHLTGTGPYNSNTTDPLSGRMIMTQTITLQPSGSGCSQAAQCAADASQCDGVAQSQAQAPFQAFINAGLINTVSQLTNTSSISFTVNYQ